MFLVDIRIKSNQLSDDEKKALMGKHQEWFKSYVAKGIFLMVGPSKTYQDAGIIIAGLSDRKSLDKILSEDPFYPDKAEYHINEFTPMKILDSITNYEGK